MDINIYSILSFTIAAVNLLLGSYVLSKNPRMAENIIFALLSAAIAFWNFGSGMAATAANAAQATFWIKFEWIGVSFLGALFLHLALSFSKKKKVLASKWTIPAIYGPCFVVLYAAWATGILVTGVEPTSWAKYSPIYNRTAFGIYGVYFEIVLFIELYIFWKMYMTSESELEKRQAKYLLAATAVPIIGGSVSNVILPVMGFHVFPVAGPLTAIMAILIAYAMTRHRLMSLIPMALENVVNGITQGVVISDAFGCVIKVNSSAGQVPGIKHDAVGQKFAAVLCSLLPKIEEPNEFEQLVMKANANPEETFNSKIVLCVPNKRFIDISISPVKDDKGGIIGQVVIFYDITERKESEEELKKLNQELQSKVAELKRFNDIAVGRELKMIELKKRIAELEGKK